MMLQRKISKTLITNINSGRLLPVLTTAHTFQSRGRASGPISIAHEEERGTEVKSFEDIPGPRSLPIIGSFYKYLPFIGEYSFTQPHASDVKKYEKYGPIIKEELFQGHYMVKIFDPDDIATLFRNEGKHPKRMPLGGIASYRESKGTSPGLASVNGEEWQQFRSQVQKKMMKRTSPAIYIPAQEAIADEFVECMRTLIDTNGEIPDYLNELYKWAMESIGVVCFDSRLGTISGDQSSDSEAQSFINAVNGAFQGIHKATFFSDYYKNRPNSATMRNLYSHLDTIMRISKKHIDSTLKKVANKEEMLVPPEESLLLSLLSKPDLKESEALSLVIDLFFGGVDTTAHTMAFVLNQLTQNPDVQARLQSEIDEIAPKGTPLTHGLIDKMRYLKAITKETARISPTTAGTMRITDYDIVLSGYRIPAGTSVLCGNTVACMQSKYFDNPEKFMPERWLRDEAGNKERGHAFALLPFGYGPRMCIGRRFAEQEIWLAVIKILQNFNVEYHHEPIGQFTQLISKPDKPLRFSFIERH